ncbi:hypothetical protein DER29_6854, partial [Micromonospora sp. M71_S20]
RPTVTGPLHRPPGPFHVGKAHDELATSTLGKYRRSMAR